MFPSRILRSAAAAACVAAAVACTTASAAPEAAVPVVTIDAMDFAFRMPDTLPAGRVTLRMANAGPDLHHVSVVRLKDGHRATELMQAVQAGAFPAWAEELGGPNAVVPGDTSEVTLDLPAGEYAFICVIPAADGMPHIMKGMFKPVTVRGAANREPAPRHDAVMVLDDYKFAMQGGGLKSGRRTIRIENRAAQPHEVVFVHLAPGKRGEDVLQWLERRDGPPPGRPIGGIAAMKSGHVNFVTADFPPGEYALICFLPDAGDGRPHFLHGMMEHVTIQ